MLIHIDNTYTDNIVLLCSSELAHWPFNMKVQFFDFTQSENIELADDTEVVVFTGTGAIGSFDVYSNCVKNLNNKSVDRFIYTVIDTEVTDFARRMLRNNLVQRADTTITTVKDRYLKQKWGNHETI